MTWERTHPLHRRAPLRRHVPLNRRGPKTKDWERVRRELKCEFRARGITECELQFPGCWRDEGLTFAHRRKRRHITDEAELRRVALACLPCHTVAELQGEAKMFRLINSVIERRSYLTGEAL